MASQIGNSTTRISRSRKVGTQRVGVAGLLLALFVLAAVLGTGVHAARSGSGIVVGQGYGEGDGFDVDGFDGFDGLDGFGVDTGLDGFDVDVDADDGLQDALREQQAAQKPFLARAAEHVTAGGEWAWRHRTGVGLVLAGVAAANVAFVLWVMGYLLKEEHYVVRAVRLPHTPPPKLWRVLADAAAFPLWLSVSLPPARPPAPLDAAAAAAAARPGAS
ncbi:hypothetical protein HK100_010910, partial [Physocladia obscura]